MLQNTLSPGFFGIAWEYAGVREAIGPDGRAAILLNWCGPYDMRLCRRVTMETVTWLLRGPSFLSPGRREITWPDGDEPPDIPFP